LAKIAKVWNALSANIAPGPDSQNLARCNTMEAVAQGRRESGHFLANWRLAAES
jgi:hypothetical protein